MMRALILTLSLLIALPLWAAEIRVSAGSGTLATAIAGATPGDVLLLDDGRYEGAIVIDRPLVLQGDGDAVIDGLGQGTVVTLSLIHI